MVRTALGIEHGIEIGDVFFQVLLSPYSLAFSDDIHFYGDFSDGLDRLISMGISWLNGRCTIGLNLTGYCYILASKDMGISSCSL